MMVDAGHEVIIYSGEENDAVCTDHVVSVTKAQQEEWFGAVDQKQFYPITWDPNDDHWTEMNFRASQQIRKRAGKKDFVLLIAGVCQQQIARELPGMLSCEWGIGYTGVFSPFKAFESYAWMHSVYAYAGIHDGTWYDAVMPNFFDEAEFPEHPVDEEDPYLLYVGRLIQRKGVHVALQVAEAAGLPLKIAGQGARDWGPGFVHADEVNLEGNLQYVGTVGIEERARLMAGSQGVLVPTTYIEPFGGVAVEAMMAGAPAIATDWGAFTETVKQGVGGYRFRTLGQGVEAVHNGRLLDRAAIRQYARDNYSLPAVAKMYEEWFDRLSTLWDSGWNDPRGKLELSLAD
jgi:glycosyltransferase involved in cell wall biosynthesis